MQCFTDADIKSPAYVMSSPLKAALSKKDHETFVYPKKRQKRLTRSRNRSYQQATMVPINEDGKGSNGKGNSSDFINRDSFDKGLNDQKLSTIMASLNKLHNKIDGINVDLYKEKEGIFSRMESAEDTLETVLDEQ